MSHKSGGFDFRIRFKPGDRFPFDVEESELLLHEDQETVIKIGAVGRRSIKDANWLYLHGTRYVTEEAAVRAGEHWRGQVERAFAALLVAADFGERSRNGWTSPVVLEHLSKIAGHPVVNDVHGLMTLPADTKVAVQRVEATGHVSHQIDGLLRAIGSPHNTEQRSAQRLAFDLFSAAKVATSVDASFMLLMMAVESLMQPFDRSREVQALVARLKAEVGAAALARDDEDRLLSVVGGLKRASLTQQGERLAESLGDRTYMRMQPVQFFKHCYKVRGRVAHGDAERPAQGLMTQLVGGLEQFVADLIAGPDLVDDVCGGTRA